MAKRKKLSTISLLHYWKLVFRSALFLGAVILYIVTRVRGGVTMLDELGEHRSWLLSLIWLVFVVEMILRFFPSRLESMGCQKQFVRNYKPAPGTPHQPKGAIMLIVLFWLLLNGIFGILYYINILDAGIMLLIALAYSVCDMICILFFCPFQTWFMKNKCCGSCRIYNWDYAMMFTPLVFVPDGYARSLVLISLALLAVWEYLAHRHPERFCEASNQALSCANCPEKLCHHKKQLRGFLQKNKELLRLRGSFIERKK